MAELCIQMGLALVPGERYPRARIPALARQGPRLLAKSAPGII